MSPMDQGLRVVGTVEFGGLENALSKNRIKNLILNAKEMLMVYLNIKMSGLVLDQLCQTFCQ